MRKIVQICTSYDAGEGVGSREPSYQPGVILFALCDDGTLWERYQAAWGKVDAIPQDDAPADSSETFDYPSGWPVWTASPGDKDATEVKTVAQLRAARRGMLANAATGTAAARLITDWFEDNRGGIILDEYHRDDEVFEVLTDLPF